MPAAWLRYCKVNLLLCSPLWSWLNQQRLDGWPWNFAQTFSLSDNSFSTTSRSNLSLILCNILTCIRHYKLHSCSNVKPHSCQQGCSHLDLILQTVLYLCFDYLCFSCLFQLMFICFIQEYFGIPLRSLRSVLSAAHVTTVRLILQYYNRNKNMLQVNTHAVIHPCETYNIHHHHFLFITGILCSMFQH